MIYHYRLLKLHNYHLCEEYLCVLAGPARLFLMGVIEVDSRSDSFSVVNSRFSQLHFNAELPSHTFRVDLQMQLAHSL